ncbi:hypothetical protein KFK09_028248 [Dendrobium nobile]|uniref:Reverse transcriptase domain-containing protein n=1 Tax=Dendrobium nobile TaxID=94219 RepID=A0A8T3A2M0_DENNO|nr:hypothetical protein KFK09_028248 [Dendrobium nobile]
MEEGDANSSFFHSYANARRNNNWINIIKTSTGHNTEDPTQIQEVFSEFFKSKWRHRDCSLVDWPRPWAFISDEEQRCLEAEYTKEDMQAVVNSSGKNISPGIDELLMQCVLDPKYCILINGRKTDWIIGKSGFRQGCPLPPYLFILCSQILSDALYLHRSGMDISITSSAPNVSHLFYTDDILVFSKAIVSEVKKVKKIVSNFCNWNGQSINASKSLLIFGKHTNRRRKNKISSILQFKVVKEFTYLGVKITLRRKVVSDFQNLMEVASNKLNTWGKNCISLEGKLVLVKSTFLSLPMFLSSISPVPISILKEFDKVCRSFLWNKTNGRTGLHYVSWELLCKSKNEGERGLFSAISRIGPLQAKFAWECLMKPNSLLNQIIKGKKISNQSSCPRGCVENEDNCHITARCGKLQRCITLLKNWGFYMPVFEDFNSCLDGLLKASTNNPLLANIYCTAVFLTWKSRCKLVHGKSEDSDFSIAANIVSLATVSNFIITQPENLDTNQLMLSSSWCPPPTGWIKINIDASLKSNYLAGIGGVIRDDKDRFLLAFGTHYLHWDIAQVELLAVYYLKNTLRDWMHEAQGVIIEGDNLNIIKDLHSNLKIWKKNGRIKLDLAFIQDFNQEVASIFLSDLYMLLKDKRENEDLVPNEILRSNENIQITDDLESEGTNAAVTDQNRTDSSKSKADLFTVREYNSGDLGNLRAEKVMGDFWEIPFNSIGLRMDIVNKKIIPRLENRLSKSNLTEGIKEAQPAVEVHPFNEDTEKGYGPWIHVDYKKKKFPKAISNIGCRAPVANEGGRNLKDNPDKFSEKVTTLRNT